jgi:hypothetical protein
MHGGAIEERRLKTFDFLQGSAGNALQVAVQPGRIAGTIPMA